MGAKKIETFPIQLLSLNAILIDHALQSRVATSVEYQREFSEAMLRGDQFPPVTVFFDGKVYRLADGFHRVGAAKKAGLAAVKAEVREGGKREATVFSAGANQKFSIPRSNADKKKAVWMLLDIPGWLDKTMGVIGQHVGCSSSTVATYRYDYCLERGMIAPSPRPGHHELLYPPDPPKAVASFPRALRAPAAPLAFKTLSQKLNAAGARPQDCRCGSVLGSRILYSRCGPMLWIANPDGAGRDTGTNIRLRVGDIILARQHANHAGRTAIVCYRDDLDPELAALAEAVGIELLSPDELVAAVTGEAPAPPADSPGSGPAG